MRASFGGLVLLALPACAELVTFPDDPTLADPGPWDCLGAATPTSTARETVTLRVRACDSFGDCSVPVEGLSADLCEKLDVGCTRPLALDLSPSAGVFEVEVPVGDRGFDGYLKVSSPTHPCTEASADEREGAVCAFAAGCDPSAPDEHCQVPTYAPALFFFNPPIRSEPPEPFTLSLLRLGAVPALASAAGAPFDPELGNLVVTGLDCNGTRAAGLSFELRQNPEQVMPLYMSNGILSGDLPHTDATGVGGFVGVQPGFVDVLGFAGGGAAIGGVGVQISRFAITYATLAPLSE